MKSVPAFVEHARRRVGSFFTEDVVHVADQHGRYAAEHKRVGLSNWLQRLVRVCGGDDHGEHLPDDRHRVAENKTHTHPTTTKHKTVTARANVIRARVRHARAIDSLGKFS